jgi:hypothetical protein
MNEIDINGIVTVPEGVDADKFSNEFIEWLKSKGYTFGGSIGPYQPDK